MVDIGSTTLEDVALKASNVQNNYVLELCISARSGASIVGDSRRPQAT
jgi:hypothetical protein